MSLPEWKILRRRCRKLKIKHSNSQHFLIAEEFIKLQKTFICDNVVETICLWFDMVVYPVYILVRVCMQDFSPMFVISLMKCYQLWLDWFQFQNLGLQVKEWTKTVRSLGGPWISTNTPELHSFVYAEGMERINHALLLGSSRSKKLAECPE